MKMEARTVICGFCAAEFTTTHYLKRFCSKQCQQAVYKVPIQRTCTRCCIEFVGHFKAQYCPSCRAQIRTEAASAGAQASKRKLSEAAAIATCHECGEEYLVTHTRQRFCSLRCTQRHHGAKWYAENRERAKSTGVLAKYGITFETYQAMYDGQGGRCAICSTPMELMGSKQSATAHVDHDHETGAVRALLCTRCNTGLGMFRDEPAIISSALTYLTHHKAAQAA